MKGTILNKLSNLLKTESITANELIEDLKFIPEEELQRTLELVQDSNDLLEKIENL